jgi:hypothetical protein
MMMMMAAVAVVVVVRKCMLPHMANANFMKWMSEEMVRKLWNCWSYHHFLSFILYRTDLGVINYTGKTSISFIFLM